MTDYEIVQIGLRVSEQIDFLWNFYVTACAFFIGWLLSSKVQWNPEKRKVITLLFIMFAVVNVSAIYNSYHLFEVALNSINNGEFHDNSFVREFSHSNGIGSFGAFIVHLAADLFIYHLIQKCCHSVPTAD